MPEYPQRPSGGSWPLPLQPHIDPPHPPLTLEELEEQDLTYGLRLIHRHSWRIDGTCCGCALTVHGCIARARAAKERI